MLSCLFYRQKQEKSSLWCLFASRSADSYIEESASCSFRNSHYFVPPPLPRLSNRERTTSPLLRRMPTVRPLHRVSFAHVLWFAIYHQHRARSFVSSLQCPTTSFPSGAVMGVVSNWRRYPTTA